jgi:hypothetical protein
MRWVVRKIVTPRRRSPSINSWTSRAATRVEPRGGLVEEEHLGVVEQRPGQSHSLAETIGQGAAGIVSPLSQVDGPHSAVDTAGRVGHLVEVGEALEVLDHAVAQVQAGRLGHDRDPSADLHTVLRTERYAATVAAPEVGAMRVPSVRTIVVFPAPFGPRKPNTSPWPTSKVTSAKAVRAPNRFDR